MTVSATSHSIPLTGNQLAQICTSVRWQQAMQAQAPFHSHKALTDAADSAFDQLDEPDWLEAFYGHPMIGDLHTLRAKYSQGAALSQSEQASIAGASDAVLTSLLELNQRYLKKFGFIFIVFASDKSASEMLNLLTHRISLSRSQELKNAALEQRKISHHRMESYR
ncbi:2-oxo-4-hydroxy-4-carboxy-5-ureidoimidazoline decarboxylase [Vibrio sp. SM6]|uniref:2-oxo-4-hydroxy-4-carboxy-5-ureidoimidazoline decarboxylase n=1 Tax=Vibrio agarilyticus TaxID=2726741 RepID=A0A7X8TTJ2_9VIBR|nr:2-oxo-4-hydroxy-4-carboxy-5-ureidoimidazoline decarboxylase [Vibrio agarilyticus]NLS14630.1 2-oxo-4-hydroxy-4-carboxy-5-ureidoimidazoline decarboxylase [Vibrio agarilyticus]